MEEKPGYDDLMAIVNKLNKVEDIALFTKYFVMHLCKDILLLTDDQFSYLTDQAVNSADKFKKGELNDNRGIWN